MSSDAVGTEFFRNYKTLPGTYCTENDGKKVSSDAVRTEFFRNDKTLPGTYCTESDEKKVSSSIIFASKVRTIYNVMF